LANKIYKVWEAIEKIREEQSTILGEKNFRYTDLELKVFKGPDGTDLRFNLD
jgi:hypothetical protein